MPFVTRGLVAVALLVLVTGARPVPAIHAGCEKVNEVGDCVPAAPEDGGDAYNCVLINALGACEDQYEVDDPPHAMLK